MLKRIDPWLIALLAIVSLVNAPSLGAGYELNDDHMLIRLSAADRIHAQIPARIPLAEMIQSEVLGRGRLLVLDYVFWYARACVLANSVLLSHWLNLMGAALVSVLLYQVGRQVFRKPVYGFLFSLMLMVCPAAGDVWPHLIRAEFLGLLFTSLSLICIVVPATGRRQILCDACGVLCFLAACLTKESFFLMAPALFWLRSWSQEDGPLASAGWPARYLRAAPLGYAAAGILAGLVVFFVALSAGGAAHGSSSLQAGPGQMARAALGRGGILESVAANGVWFMPALLAAGIVVVRRLPLAANDRAGLVFAFLLIAPQVLIYSTRPYFAGRYAFPMLVGVAWLNVAGMRVLFEISSARTLRCAAVVALCAWSVRSIQVQATENLNLVRDTRALRQMVEGVTSHVPERGTIVIVAPAKTETADSVLHQIGLWGRPLTAVYLFQPEGTDGHTDFCFSDMTDADRLLRNDVDAVIYLVGRSHSGIESRPWYEASRFLPAKSVSHRSFFSVRRLSFVSEPSDLEYDLRKPPFSGSRQNPVVIGRPHEAPAGGTDG